MNADPHPPTGPSPDAPAIARWVTPPENRTKARRFFEHAKKAAETRNYDYAVKLYTDGLAFWPDAMDDGLKPLRVVATARKLDGGKPAGFLESRRRSISGKDFLKNLNSALYLFGLDPTHIGHMEQILYLAAAAKCDRVVQWIAPVLADAYHNAKKQAEGHYARSCEAMNVAADLAMSLQEDAIAMDILNAAIAVSQSWAEHYPNSTDAPRARSNATGKLTIVKGRFDRGDNFTESLKDAEGQADIRDRARTVHIPDRAQELIAKARKEYEANPQVVGKLTALVDRMLASEDAAMENEAIALLEKEYAAAGNYAFKVKADEIRVRQWDRHRRELANRLKADPNNAALKEEFSHVTADQLQREIAILEERATQYPTEMRLRFQLAMRLYQAGRIDDAIPMFQMAQADGRSRTESRLYIGRCFLDKGFHEQAVGTLQKALEEADTTTGRLALELNYWLGRSLEAKGDLAQARQRYGHLITLDYNFRDARQRLERLVSGDHQQ